MLLLFRADGQADVPEDDQGDQEDVPADGLDLSWRPFPADDRGGAALLQPLIRRHCSQPRRALHRLPRAATQAAWTRPP